MFKFENLDDTTRSSMLEAIEEAESTGNIYFSTRFSQSGKSEWLALLKQSAQEFNEHWLAYQLEAKKLMKDFEGARTTSDVYTIKHVPHTAVKTIAEGQFNHFYMLGLCKRARVEGITHLEIYRAKELLEPRPESQALIGNQSSIDEIEIQLKEVKDSFNSPLIKPNSGLCVRFIQ